MLDVYETCHKEKNDNCHGEGSKDAFYEIFEQRRVYLMQYLMIALNFLALTSLIFRQYQKGQWFKILIEKKNEGHGAYSAYKFYNQRMRPQKQ